MPGSIHLFHRRPSRSHQHWQALLCAIVIGTIPVAVVCFMHIDCSASIDQPSKEMSSLCCPASVVPVQEGARCKSLARIQGIGVSVVCVDVHNAFPFSSNSSSDSGSHGTTHLPEDALFRGDPRRHHQFFSFCLLVAVAVAVLSFKLVLPDGRRHALTRSKNKLPAQTSTITSASTSTRTSATTSATASASATTSTTATTSTISKISL